MCGSFTFIGDLKIARKNNVAANIEWTITFNVNVNQTLLTDNHIFVTNQHGRKVEVDIEMIHSKMIKIKPYA